MPDYGLERVIGAFEEALRELLEATPAILVSILIMAAVLVVARLANGLVRKLMRSVGLDEVLERAVGRSPISLEALVVLMLDVGFVLLGTTIIVTLFAPAYVETYHAWVGFILRVLSAIALTVTTFFWIEALVNRIRAESKIRAFAGLVAFLLIMAFVIDVTALSESVKSSLVFGIALGMGLSIGVFALWYFMREYFDKLIEAISARRGQADGEALRSSTF